MKNILLILLFISAFSKGQTIIDSLSINPNPFQNKTLMYYSFTNNDTVTINVRNVVGAIVYSPITNSVMPTGIYQDTLDMTSQANGIYFVQLKLGHRKTITKKIIKSTTAGITENKNIAGNIKIYPNPFLNELTIESINPNTSDIKKIIITNTLGQTIYETEFYQNDLTIGLVQLQNGIYFIQLYINNQLNFRTKIIKL